VRSPAFAWPFHGAPLLPGVEPTPAFDESDRRRLAPALGRFLRELHALPVPPGLPHDPLGRVDMTRRVPFATEWLAELAMAGVVDHRAAAQPILDAARDLPPSGRAALVHGDLHFRHILVDRRRSDPLVGVIDWGDLCRGDPAMDLHVAWSLLPSGARPAFWAAYGPIEPDQALRARVVGLFLGAVLASYGEREGLPDVRDEALASLERTLED
jgi:aminoglycoside phosphotransferase (APT) family kinase protein